jgi:stage II sporulation protein D
MKFPCKSLILLVVCSLYADAGAPELSQSGAPVLSLLEQSEKQNNKLKPLHVRVLLDVRKAGDLDPWHINGKKEIFVTDLAVPAKKIKHEAVRAQVAQAGVAVTDVREQKSPLITKALRIQSPDGYLCVDGTWYQGSLYFVMEGNSALLINNIEIEDYIYSVLKTESMSSWPIEMHKVLAIASRTYVIAKIMEAQKLNRLYHIKNTNAHQTYTGYHETKAIKQAVDETRDLFLAYNNKPILAMYDICCGGLIPSKKSGVNFEHAPYLARTYACTFCKKAKVYNWSANYTFDYLETALKRDIPNLKKIKDIKIIKKDHAGTVQKVVIKAASGHHHLRGKRMYSLLKNIKSFCFSIENTGKKIVFKGRGYGHHMGLCQWGARQMVQEGWPYHRILKYYYPTTQIMKLDRIITA